MSSEISTNQGLVMPSSSGSDQSRFSNQLKTLMQYNVPSHLLDDEDDSKTKDDEDELTSRQEQENLARERRTASAKELKAANLALSEFKQLLTLYNVAENVRNPSANQQQTIVDMNQSVVDVDVTPGADSMQHRIAARSLQLKKALDDARTAWDRDCKVLFPI